MVKHWSNMAAHDDVVVLDADLAGSTRSGKFGAKFPERFFNVGIAEANMTGMTAGFAAVGKYLLQIHLLFF